jgi:hypothetical protein
MLVHGCDFTIAGNDGYDSEEEAGGADLRSCYKEQAAYVSIM